MNSSRKAALLAKTIDASSFKTVGVYTHPRSYGVYRLTAKKKKGRTFRFGNHPVRRDELVREFGGVEVMAMFLNRRDAEELAAIENSLSNQ